MESGEGLKEQRDADDAPASSIPMMHHRSLEQWPPTFMAPVTGFMEDNFSMDWGRGWFQDDLRALYLSCT